MQLDTMLTELEQGVFTITLNRPDRLNDRQCNQDFDRDRRQGKLGVIHECPVDGVGSGVAQGNAGNMGASRLQDKQQ